MTYGKIKHKREKNALQWRKPRVRHMEKKRANGGTSCLKLCHVALESISMVKEGPMDAIKEVGSSMWYNFPMVVDMFINH
jgi:hypothetical protein